MLHGVLSVTICVRGPGTCVNGTCDCGFNGGRGDYCEQPGCPGYDEDCTGHRTCNVATGTCLCFQGSYLLPFIVVCEWNRTS